MRIPRLLCLALLSGAFASATQIVTTLPLGVSTFDYIVVGGGVAGLVLGNRLSGDGRNFSVLVIEAGGDPRGQALLESPNLSVLGDRLGQRGGSLHSRSLQRCSAHAHRTVRLEVADDEADRGRQVADGVWVRGAHSGLATGALMDDTTRGKVLGGSSSINGLIWSRGAKEQYDAIAALGNPGWTWKDMQRCVVARSRLAQI